MRRLYPEIQTGSIYIQSNRSNRDDRARLDDLTASDISRLFTNIILFTENYSGSGQERLASGSDDESRRLLTIEPVDELSRIARGTARSAEGTGLADRLPKVQRHEVGRCQSELSGARYEPTISAGGRDEPRCEVRLPRDAIPDLSWQRRAAHLTRLNTGGPDGLLDRKVPGPTPRLTPEQRRVLAALVESGPIPAVDGVVRWRLVDLVQWVFEEFRISLSPQTMSRELRAMGYRRLSARPRHHAQDPEAVSAFKKTSLPFWRRSGRGSAPAPHWNSGGKTRRA